MASVARIQQLRGYTTHRHVYLPLTPKGIVLGDKLVAEYGTKGMAIALPTKRRAPSASARSPG